MYLYLCVFLCVCMCVLYVCIHICAGVLACEGMCGGERLIFGYLPQSLLHSFCEVQSCTELSSLIELDWLISTPASPELGLEALDPHLPSYTGTGDLNSGPNACMTCTLPTDINLPSPSFYKRMLSSYIFSSRFQKRKHVEYPLFQMFRTRNTFALEFVQILEHLLIHDEIPWRWQCKKSIMFHVQITEVTWRWYCTGFPEWLQSGCDSAHEVKCRISHTVDMSILKHFPIRKHFQTRTFK